MADGRRGEPVLGVGLAVTVGNRPDGSLGDTPVPDIAGRSVPAGKLEEELGMDVLAATTTSEAVPVKDRAPEATASAEIFTRTPTPAASLTRTFAASSAAWPTGKAPTAHVAPSGWGHTVKAGLVTYPAAVLARTDTAWLFAFVDQTQITKVASWPALTLPAPESGWTRTHSCGVTFFFFFGLGDLLGVGLGELEVVLGVGEGELEVVLGVGEGDVEVEAEVDDFGSGADDVAGALDEVLLLADVLGEGDGLLLAEVLGVADEFADLNGDEELASAAAESWPVAALFVADDSAVLFGMDPHSVDFLVV